MRRVKLYRGISSRERGEMKRKGYIPCGKNFTTSYMGAKQHGVVVAVQKSKVFVPKKQNWIFNKLKIKEKYYTNKKPIRKFREVIEP